MLYKNGLPRTEDVECPKLNDPVLGGKKRTLNKCNLYVLNYTNTDYNAPGQQLVWTESGTNYPVMVKVSVQVNGNWKNLTSEQFTSFDPEMPVDRTRTGPMAGVKVWDLRSGKDGLYDGAKSAAEGNSWFHGIRDMFVSKKQGPLVLEGEMYSVAGVFGPDAGPAPVQSRLAREPVPASFDAREHWPECSTIKEITNQLTCGSCWAMSGSAVLSNRVCIATHGSVNVALSPQYMVNCFTDQQGCGGGWDEPVWHDMMEIGTVPDACVPFTAVLDACPQHCADGTAVPERTRAKNFYSPWGETDAARVEAIQREIMERGPVVANYHVFSDFQKYEGPVYKRSKTAVRTGGHAVRIIGWGTENGEDYWLVANSWGTGWKEDGFFKIRRGTNECNIEEAVTAGEPLIN